MVILKENQVSMFFTLIETEERGPRVYTEKRKNIGKQNSTRPARVQYGLFPVGGPFSVFDPSVSPVAAAKADWQRRLCSFTPPPPCLRSYSSGRLLAASSQMSRNTACQGTIRLVGVEGCFSERKKTGRSSHTHGTVEACKQGKTPT